MRERDEVPKRQQRQRVFRVCVDGTHEWTEDAGHRSLYEFQHKLATERFVGSHIRVREQFLGGAKAKLVLEDEDIEP